MWALVPVREPRGPAGPRGPLVPVSLDLLVPVGGTNRDQCALVLAHHHWSRLMAWTGTNGFPLVPAHVINRDQWGAYIYPLAQEQSTVLCFFWPRGRGLCGALAHLLCTWGVRWNARATLLKLSPLEARPPSSFFLEICLDLAVRHAPSPSSPPSITRTDLITDTTVVSLLFLSSFWKEKIFLLECLHRYLYYFLTFIIASYIVRWFWYLPPSALVLSMIRMWYILSL